VLVFNLSFYNFGRDIEVVCYCGDVRTIFLHRTNFVNWSNKLCSKRTARCLPICFMKFIDY